MPHLARVKSPAPAEPPAARTAQNNSTGDVPASITRALDRSLRAMLARYTGGLSPAALGGAYLDWAIHLAGLPGKQIALANGAMASALMNVDFAVRCAFGAEQCQAIARYRTTTDFALRTGQRSPTMLRA